MPAERVDFRLNVKHFEDETSSEFRLKVLREERGCLTEHHGRVVDSEENSVKGVAMFVESNSPTPKHVQCGHLVLADQVSAVAERGGVHPVVDADGEAVEDRLYLRLFERRVIGRFEVTAKVLEELLLTRQVLYCANVLDRLHSHLHANLGV